MSEVGTLSELDLKPGDVVVCVDASLAYNDCEPMTFDHKVFSGFVFKEAYGHWHGGDRVWSVISRAAAKTDGPTLWRDMTPGTPVDVFDGIQRWKSGYQFLCYHNAPGDEREWVVVAYKGDIPTAYSPCSVRKTERRVTVDVMADFKKIGTIDLIDGKPDMSSIKMEGV